MDGKVIFPYAEPKHWAQKTFGAVDLGDRRRTRRLVVAAATIASHPEKSFNQVFDWNGLRGFYNLCHREEATLKAVQGPHWEQTRQAMCDQPLVLNLHDTTELDFTSHQALTDAGPIGDGNGTGFLQHNSLAVIPKPRQVLGLTYQQLRIRKPAPKGENAYQRRRRRDRESLMWTKGITALGPAPEGCCWVDVCDCGGDMYDSLRTARELNHHVLFRAGKDRTVFHSGEREGEVYLRAHARSLPSQGTDKVEIPGRGGREARTATVSLAATQVWMPAPAGYPKRWSQPIFKVWVIRIWEADPPEGIDEPLEWILICSLPTETVEQIKERRDWYACRWTLETFHDIEKNGCSEEDRRFETADRMKTCLAILSVVAVRVFQLRTALDSQPNAPAQEVATEAEITVMRRHRKHKGKSFTVRDFVRSVASLGGFLGRKGDGKPGVRSLWKGYQRLQDMLVGFHAHDSPKSNAARKRQRSW